MTKAKNNNSIPRHLIIVGLGLIALIVVLIILILNQRQTDSKNNIKGLAQENSENSENKKAL